MSENSIRSTAAYGELLDSIKEAIATAKLRAAQAANSTLIELY